MIKYFITGTDTGVGKTVFSLLLMQLLYSKGHNPFYFKPVQTGCKYPYDTDSDARFIYENIESLNSKNPENSIGYCFKMPKAPYFASKAEGIKININNIQDIIDTKKNVHSHMVIEAAGGLLVPFDNKLMIIDLIKIFQVKPILVSRAGLGTINHTLLSLEALKNRNIKPAGVVFMDNAYPPTPSDFVKENIYAIEKESQIPVIGVINKIDDFSKPGEDCHENMKQIGDALGL